MPSLFKAVPLMKSPLAPSSSLMEQTMLLFPGSLCSMGNICAKTSDVVMPLMFFCYS